MSFNFQKPYLGHILLAEDDEIFSLKLQKSLKSENIRFTVHSDFSSAHKALLNNSFHALVTDVFLNSDDPNGLDLIKTASNIGLPVVMMTSMLDLKIAKTGLNNGANHLLEKPFKIKELKNILEDLWENPRGLIGRRERCFAQYQLTPKERELCRLILKGLSNQEIADITESTLGTIKVYASQIFEKFNVSSRGELFNLVFPT